MAASSKSTREIAKRVINHIFTRDPTQSSTRSATARRSAHTSAYDKNVDDQVQATAVPDDVIQPESEKYWAPHPQTGVFGPAAEAAGAERVSNSSPAVERGSNSLPAATNSQNNSDTVLEEKAWFRPTSLEDMEKPHHH